ncbi:MAG: undecaprenyl-diphosphate phosphatase [Ruminococcaceae bacterium]|nr:undecaprenyl-diphosphate phosphatase [Oscillospiraceae bacterium]
MLFFEILKAILYGIIEGITEWLPVSSTGHLILLGEWLPFTFTDNAELMAEFSEMFEVVIQLGAILAVIFLFWGKLCPFGKSKTPEQKSRTWRLWLRVVIASIPAAVVGILFDKVLEIASGKDINGWLYNAYVVAAALIVYGIAFIVIEKFNANRNVQPSVVAVEDISCKKAFAVGAFQALSIVPGTSRSGSTILGSMFLGLSRTAAAEFSFFMAIPAMVGASGIKALGFVKYVAESSVSVPFEAWIILAVASVVSFTVSMAAIKFLMDFVKRHSFASFGVYRIILGALVIAYFLFVK